MLAKCGAWSAPMCWPYVMLGVHLCVEVLDVKVDELLKGRLLPP